MFSLIFHHVRIVQELHLSMFFRRLVINILCNLVCKLLCKLLYKLICILLCKFIYYDLIKE